MDHDIRLNQTIHIGTVGLNSDAELVANIGVTSHHAWEAICVGTILGRLSWLCLRVSPVQPRTYPCTQLQCPLTRAFTVALQHPNGVSRAHV